MKLLHDDVEHRIRKGAEVRLGKRKGTQVEGWYKDRYGIFNLSLFEDPKQYGMEVMNVQKETNEKNEG
jgi:hypothetical protein